MTSKKLRPGSHLMVGNSVTTGTVGYPDPLGAGAAPVGSYGLTTALGSSLFSPAGRSVILKTVWVAPAAAAQISLETHDGSEVIMVVPGAAFASTRLSFGPEGLYVPGGFRVTITGSLDFAVTYEVV